MSDPEAQVSSVLEIMVNATVTEMSKVIGASSTNTEVSAVYTVGNTEDEPDEKVTVYLCHNFKVSY